MPIVIDDESDDDLPLFARPRATMPAKREGSSDEEPDWMKSFKSPTAKADDDDSDDGMILDIFQRKPNKTEEKFEMKSTPAKMVRSPPAGATKEAGDDDKDADENDDDEAIEIDEEDDDDDDDDGPAAKPKPKTPTPKKVGDQSLNGSTRHNTWTRDKMPGQGSSAGANRPGEIPLLMPANVNRNKVFFELEGTGEAVDLEGDVGVVGRLLSNTSEKHGSGLQMDMKGVIYDARILPTPASVVILAVNATEAKVESITHDFVQLRRDPVANGGPGATLDGYLGADSDDEAGTHRAAAGHSAAAAVRAMDDVSDHEGEHAAGGKRKSAGAGAGGGGKRRGGGGGGGGGGGARRRRSPLSVPRKNSQICYGSFHGLRHVSRVRSIRTTLCEPVAPTPPPSARMALSVASVASSLVTVAGTRPGPRGGRRVVTRVDNRIILRDDIVSPMRRARVSIFRASFRDRDGRVDDDDPSAASPNDAAQRITAALLSASVLMTSAPGDAFAIAFPNATETLFPTEASPTLMNIPDGTPTKLDAEETDNVRLFRDATPSVAFITNKQLVQSRYSLDATETPVGAGTGFVWDDKGHVVTNFHVVKGANELSVTFQGDQKTYGAKLLGYDEDKDVAVLSVEKPELRPIPLGCSSTLLVGQKVFAIGNPFGLDHTLTTGIVSGLGRELPSGNTGRPILGVIQTDAAINPGNSGGPLLDSRGRLIGVNTAIYSPSGASAGVGFALPVDNVKGIVEQIIQFGRVTRPVLGLVLAPDGALRQLIGENGRDAGVLVLGVPEGGPAARAGIVGTVRDTLRGDITLGDVIVRFNDEDVKNSSDLYRALDMARVGQEVTLTVRRGNAKVEVSVTLGEKVTKFDA